MHSSKKDCCVNRSLGSPRHDLTVSRLDGS